MTDELSAKEKLDQIRGDATTIEVRGVEFEINPLDNDEFLAYISDANNSDKDKGEVAVELVTMILQKDDPDWTVDMVREGPPGLVVKVMNAFEDVNGLEDFTDENGNPVQNPLQ